MRPDALALANYLITLAKEEGKSLGLLKLVKLVYIAHGYILAQVGRSALNERFDWVEAWKYGPVIPSVYHTFKWNGRNPITQLAQTLIPSEEGTDFTETTPILQDEKMKASAKMAFRHFSKLSGEQLVEILHHKGTPWEKVYREGENCKISDNLTQVYYIAYLKKLAENVRKARLI